MPSICRPGNWRSAKISSARARFVFHRTESEPGHSGVHLHMHLQPSGPERGLILPRRFEGVYRHADIFRSGGRNLRRVDRAEDQNGPLYAVFSQGVRFPKACHAEKPASQVRKRAAAGSMPTP